MIAQLTADDRARLAALRELQLLDAPTDQAFDRLTRLASRLLGVPVTFITLLDEDRDFYLSECGFPEPLSTTRELRGDTFCRHALMSDAPLVIADTNIRGEPWQIPAAASAGIGAYAGVPLRLGDGVVIGTFCAVDVEPHDWSEDDVLLLEELAVSAVTEMEVRRATRKATAERKKYRELVDGLDAIVWEMDLATWQFTFINRYAQDLLGYSRDRWLNEPAFWQDVIVHPDDRVEALTFCAQAVAAGEDHEFEYRAVAEDGRVLWLHDHVRIVVDGSSDTIRLRGVMVDVTDRRTVADALSESEERFRQLAESIHAVFWLYDVEAERTIYLSPAYETIWGQPVAAIFADSRAWADAIHPDDRERVLSLMAASRRTSYAIEYRIVRPDGAIRWIHDRGFTVHNAAGEIYRTAGVAQDITEERALREESRLLAAALHSLEEGVTITRYDGQIVYANATHARMLGYDLEEQPLPEMRRFHADAESEAMVSEAMRHAIEHGSWSGRIRRRRTDGTVKTFGNIFGRIDREVGAGLLFTISRDATADIEKEQHLRRAERLASVGTLVGGVAHELNNPLHSIVNFAGMLLNVQRPEEERQDLEIIRREALRAAKIVSDLRLLARQTQEVVRSHAHVDLNDVVSHVVKTRAYALATHNIEVRQDLAAELPPIWADRGQIEQVLINLVVNAQQSMEQTAVKRQLILRTRATSAGVSVQIVDSGIGIAADALDRIFDPFYTTKSPGEGTGLGLSLVHSIVTEHGGDVHVESEPGKGTAFRIDFPRATPSSVAAAGHTATRTATTPLRVLVVDDEPAIRLALSRYLSRRGHDVHVAADGSEALRLIDVAATAAALYDVIISDLRMPGLGGEQLLLRLRRDGRGMDSRIIFLTGDAASGDAARILADANVPVIYKPVELAELAVRIEAFAQRS